MDTPQTRRSSLETDCGEGGSNKLNESFLSSEFSLPFNCSNNNTDNNQMELSQISDWSGINSATAAKWDIVLPLDLNFDSDINFSDGNLSDDNEEANSAAAKASLHDIFVEDCCTLYNDIQNAIDELEFEEQIPCIEKLEDRQKSLRKKARLLAETAIDLCDIVNLRMQTIDRAMEQLKLRTDLESARSSSRENPHSPIYQLRIWLRTIESTLEQFRNDIILSNNSFDLQKLCADQKELQAKIEKDGQALLNSAKKYLQTRPLTDGKKIERAQRNLDQLEHRLLSARLLNLENWELASLKQQQDCETPPENLSDDEEPLIKRRRTTSSSSTANTLPALLCLPQYSTASTDVLLIPSSTESECATEDDNPDIIPFMPSDYESYTKSSMPEQQQHHSPVSSPPPSPDTEQPSSINVVCSTSRSSRQLHDVGYSSGENSIHESLNLIGEELLLGDVVNENNSVERRMRLKLTPTKGFYKTVPLDDAGVTDTEVIPQLPFEMHGDREVPNDDNNILSESMIVQSDMNSSNMVIPDDYQEVMSMMEDDDFEARINQLKKGTQWKELKPKRISTPKRSVVSKTPSEVSKYHRDTDFSCEASSEESDSGKDKSRQSLFDGNNPSAAAALPPIPPQQRKRRFKRAVRTTTQNSSNNGSGIMKNSLTNIGMDESVYIFPENDNPMSQSLSASFFGSKTPTTISKRKHDKRRIHRSASDYVNFSWNVENISNSFHSFANFEPLMTSTLKKQQSPSSLNHHHHRRPSVESFASTTSSGTVQETGDAHYEWDDYKDPPSLSEIMPHIVQLEDPSASTSSILDNTIIDDDFQSQIPLTDPSEIDATIYECQQNYYKVRRIMNEYDPFSNDKKDVKKALRMNAKENVKKLTAIVKGFPRNISMDQINDVDLLQKEFKSALDELGPSEEDDGEVDPDVQMEIDEANVNEIKIQLAEMKTALKMLLIQDSEKMTISDLEGFIMERKQIWDNLMKRKSSLQHLAEQPGNRYNNGELVALLKIVEQSLQTIGDSTLHLEASMAKYHSMGNLKDSLKELKDKLANTEAMGVDAADEIRLELDLCQERMDALETVCNGLTTQLEDLAVLSGDRKPGKQAKFWKELKDYKNSLKQLREKFSKASIKPIKTPSPKPRKRKTKEISTNTASISTTSSSTTTTTTSIPAASPRRRSLPRRLLQRVKNSRVLQGLLGTSALLLLGLILITCFLDDSPQNNWRHMFGPQLDYVNGAPPS